MSVPSVHGPAAPRGPTISPQDIERRQNQEPSLRLLAATRQKYTQAKLIRRVKWVITVALLIAGPALYLLQGQPAVAVAATSACWLVVSRTLLIPQELVWRHQGAYLADRLDSIVFDLPRSRAVPTNLVTREESSAAAARYMARQLRRRRILRRPRTDPLNQLRDWFAVPTRLNGDELVLACQRGSAEYARRMAMEWSRVCDIGWVVIVVASVAIGIAADLSLPDYLVIFALPAVPAILDGIDAARLHRDMARARRSVVNAADLAILERATTAIPDDLPRALQDAAWRWRTLGPGVPDLYHRLRRQSLDKDAAAVAAELD